jgi:hypothetical protein
LLPSAAKRVFFRGGGIAVNALRLLANCGERSDGTVIADFRTIETVSMTRTALAFTHVPSVCAEICRARASVSAA